MDADLVAKSVDDMDLGDLMKVAIAHGDEPNRAHLLRAVVLGRLAERRVDETLEAVKQIMPLAVRLAATAARQRATRRTERLARFRARRLR